MLDKKVIELLNDQINKEFYSAYLYLDIANYYTDNDLDGFGNWYTIQAQEERDHAMLFLKYLQSNGVKVTLKPIDQPDKVFKNHLEPLLTGAEHDREYGGVFWEVDFENGGYDYSYEINAVTEEIVRHQKERD